MLLVVAHKLSERPSLFQMVSPPCVQAHGGTSSSYCIYSGLPCELAYYPLCRAAPIPNPVLFGIVSLVGLGRGVAQREAEYGKAVLHRNSSTYNYLDTTYFVHNIELNFEYCLPSSVPTIDCLVHYISIILLLTTIFLLFGGFRCCFISSCSPFHSKYSWKTASAKNIWTV